ncbi:MAG: DegT/DnrJ/EryC1/StrS family aminotransferase, partial [Dehalococcoidia bacterium]|nr:DegT/DnrJ/EryC1/StrS family aminotransferase [Dehalococcoidia bacterium]
MIPVLRPTYLGEEAEAVREVLEGHWWGEGEQVAIFERTLAARYQRKHCIAVNSCTAALHLAVLSHGIGPGDEVILPALTFVSTGLAVLYAGATPVFADVRPDTLTLDWADVDRRITAKTKAVMPVDYAGYPAYDGGKENGALTLPLIQDAAHSCGGTGYGLTVCLSFHPV